MGGVRGEVRNDHARNEQRDPENLNEAQGLAKYENAAMTVRAVPMSTYTAYTVLSGRRLRTKLQGRIVSNALHFLC